MISRGIPGGLVRLVAGPYVAGDSLGAGLETAAALRQQDLLTTLDLLGEDVRTEEQAVENRRLYERMIDALGADARFRDRTERPTVSLKPSSFTARPLGSAPDADARGSAEAITTLAARATERGVGMTIDMEDRHWTDFTLELAGRLFAEGHDVGTVLQTRLDRTERDLAGIPAGMRLRLVIGIYREPADVATRSKAEMKERLLHAAATLLARGVSVEVASHDTAVIRSFLGDVVPRAGAARDAFELQFLYGVPVEPLLAEIASGTLFAEEGCPPRVRLYVPFATSWDEATAYCRRRLDENPQLGVYVARNIVRSFLGARAGRSRR